MSYNGSMHDIIIFFEGAKIGLFGNGAMREIGKYANQKLVFHFIKSGFFHHLECHRFYTLSNL